MKLYRNRALAILAIAATSLLYGCSGDDNGDGKTAAAIDRQNELLAQQNEQQSNSVTLFGKINFLDSNELLDASVKIRVGTTWSDPVATTGEDFEIGDVEPNSDFLLVFESPTDAFLPRTVFGQSRENSAGDIFQDIGTILVSQGVERSFSVLDNETGEAITDLVFSGSSSFSSGTGGDEYLHTSAYDEASALYRITVPESIQTILYANLDIDGDGQIEYTRASSDYIQYNSHSSETLSINSLNLGDDASSTLLLTRVEENINDIQLRVSVIDNFANQIPNLTLSIVDTINGNLEASFNDNTLQYVFDAQLENSLEILIPAFTQEVEGDVLNYASASINLRIDSDDVVRVFIDGGNNYSNYEVSLSDSLDLAIQPRLTTPSSSIELVAVSDEILSDYSFRLFYSKPIELPVGSARLYQEDVISIVRGNDSSDDLILPGTTLITAEDIEVESLTQLQLNNTLLTLSPVSTLTEGQSFRYEVGDIIDPESQIEADLYNDATSFNTTSTEVFNISDLVLDNQNYTTNGSAIIAANTAGTASNTNNYSNSTYLFMPKSVENLKSLTISKRATIEGTRVELSNQNYNVVDDGVFNGYFNIAVDVAENESISSNTGAIRGSTLTEGRYWYSLSIGEYMSDNTISEANTVEFEYALERKNGAIETGTFTLSVR